MRLFGRTYKITAQSQPSASGFVGANPQFFETVDAGIEITKLHVSFDLTKNLGKEPNKCTIKVVNASPDTRAFLDRLPVKITLAAGYDGAPRLLFTGDLLQAFPKKEGTDVVLTMQVGDGLRAYAHARAPIKSYPASTTLLRILEDAAKTMGLSIPPELAKDARLKQTIPLGVTAAGATRDFLTRILAPYGYKWSIQNGRLQVLRDEDLRPGQIIVINKAAGLIGTPEKTAPETPGQKASKASASKASELKFDVKLYPELNPGQEVLLESEEITARCKVLETKTTGDSRKGDWKTAVTARPL